MVQWWGLRDFGRTRNRIFDALGNEALVNESVGSIENKS